MPASTPSTAAEPLTVPPAVPPAVPPVEVDLTALANPLCDTEWRLYPALHVLDWSRHKHVVATRHPDDDGESVHIQGRFTRAEIPRLIGFLTAAYAASTDQPEPDES